MLNAIRSFVDFRRIVSLASTSLPLGYHRRLWQGMSHGWQSASRYYRLSIMSNEELAGRGLDRASIGRHAFFADGPCGRD